MLGPYYVDPAHAALFLVHGLVETVTNRLRAAYARARTVLETHTPALHTIASELAEAGYLSAKDVDRIMQAQAAPAHPVEPLAPALAMGEA